MFQLRWIVVIGIGMLGLTSACLRQGEFACSSDTGCVNNGVPGKCELDGYCSFPDIRCESGRRFADFSGPLSNQCITIPIDAGVDVPVDVAVDAAPPTTCTVPGNAALAWTLIIPAEAVYNVQADVLYATDNRTALASTNFTRVAYCLELDSSFVYTEMDDFTNRSVQETGIPTESVFDTLVTKLTVRTNVSTVAEVTNATGGKIEFWSNCYAPGLNGVHDYEDDMSTTIDCYGSFQVHHNTTTALAFNRWSNGAGDDLGIGNQSTSHPDWTFAQNGASYTSRKLRAFILP